MFYFKDNTRAHCSQFVANRRHSDHHLQFTFFIQFDFPNKLDRVIFYQIYLKLVVHHFYQV